MATPYKTKVQDGTAGAPAVAFDDDTNLGIYRVGADELGISAAGALVASVNTRQFIAPSGETTLNSSFPGITFKSAADNAVETGIGLFEDEDLQIICDGATMMLFRAGQIPENIACYEDFLLQAEKSLGFRESTAHVDTRANYGQLYTLDSDSSLYYVNSSGATFVVNMTAL